MVNRCWVLWLDNWMVAWLVKKMALQLVQYWVEKLES